MKIREEELYKQKYLEAKQVAGKPITSDMILEICKNHIPPTDGRVDLSLITLIC
jgi:hypothetical protein